MKRLFVIGALSALMTAPAFADPPAHANNDKGKDRGDRDRAERDIDTRIDVGDWFQRDRRYADYGYTWYDEPNCPPGLAKKAVPCVPPGQAKKMYSVGQRLPRDIGYDPVYRDWLPETPYGYEYRRVGEDILLVQLATGLVVDALIN